MPKQSAKVLQLQSEVRDLSAEELAEFRDWFYEFDNELWDQQLEGDVKSGKLDKLAEQALREYAAGQTKEL